MSTQPLPQPPAPRSPELRQSLGTIVIGGILVLAGLFWILDVLDLVSLSLGVILPSALILVGIALLAGSLTGTHGGLIALGIILTVVLTAAAAVNVPLNNGIGDRSFAPASVTDLPEQYELMIGNMQIDLTNLDLPDGVTTVQARVGIGELAIDVPRDVAVEVHWTVSGGNVDVFGVSQNGSSLDDRTQTPGYSAAAKQLVIEAHMGFGNIEVR